jgi:hypothetical protein
MLGGGALALLALGGAAVAMRRRRRHEDEVMVEDHIVEEDVVHEPVAEPVPIAVTPRHDPVESWTPAMAPAPLVHRSASAMHADTGRRSGETWVERAHRGPTPDNPSLSLRKRLKRAAFFDARERQVAEGRAEPVAIDAGLPDNVTASAPTHEREREHAFA